jgi:hypothetical protein
VNVPQVGPARKEDGAGNSRDVECERAPRSTIAPIARAVEAPSRGLDMILCALFLSCAQEATAPAHESADLIVEGKVFTSAAQRPWAEAVAVRGDRIAAVGSRDEVSAWRGEKTRVISAGKGVVVPGFNDAHCHFTVGYSFKLDVDLTTATNLAEILALVKSYAAAHPDDEGDRWRILGPRRHRG